MHTNQHTASAFAGIDIPSDDIITNCMHCGLCLPTCPTFALTGLETSSPRGRIRLIKSVAEGKIGITTAFVNEMSFCLDCQACETACPAGVQYGSLVETARAQIFEQRKEPLEIRWMKKIFLRWFFASHQRLKFLARTIRFTETSGLLAALNRSGILRLFFPTLNRQQQLAPSISRQFSTETLRELMPAVSKEKYRVAFLTGCVMDVAFADVNNDTVRLLTNVGCSVVIPKNQSCCGSLLAHNGDRRAARAFAADIIEQFSDLKVDAIVMNSAGCGAFLKEYAHLFAEDPKFAVKAKRVSAKTKDLTEFLFENNLIPDKPLGESTAGRKKVAYHEACHLVHAQKVSVQPRSLLNRLPGIELVELPESTWCCGSAGIYNLLEYESSMQLLDRKMQNIEATAPDIIATGNPGCVIQIQHGIRARKLPIQVMHTATLLRRVYAP